MLEEVLPFLLRRSGSLTEEVAAPGVPAGRSLLALRAPSSLAASASASRVPAVHQGGLPCPQLPGMIAMAAVSPQP